MGQKKYTELPAAVALALTDLFPIVADPGGTPTTKKSTLQLLKDLLFKVGQEVTGTTQAMAINTQYIANNASLVTLTLPATAALGDRFEVLGKGAGLWKIAQNSGQTIRGASSSTTGTGGSVTAQTRYDCITLVCIAANTDFVIVSQRGTLTVV